MAWVSPRTYTAAAVLTAAQLNETRDSLKAIGDAWTAYTPTWTSTGTAPALGNGTITGSYLSAGKLTAYRVKLVTGSTTTYGTGNYSFTLPVASVGAASQPHGSAIVLDLSAASRYIGVPFLATGTTVQVLTQPAAGVSATVGQTSPMTWATGDELHLSSVYEAA